MNPLKRKGSTHEHNFTELAESTAVRLATAAPLPKRSIGFINPEDKGKKTQARQWGAKGKARYRAPRASTSVRQPSGQGLMAPGESRSTCCGMCPTSELR